MRPPYRPYLQGPPRFAVALMPIAPEHWLRPETEAEALPERRARLTSDTAAVFRERATSRPAQAEALALIRAHLGAPANEADAAPPLPAAATLISDDLVIMQADAGGWLVSALVLCQPTFFSIDDAFDRDLAALHAPVPGGAGLSGRIARVFDHVAQDRVLERFNWTLQLGPDRFTPSGHAMRERAAALGSRAADGLHLRVERQTVRRLPQTGAILFTIRVSIDPVSAIPAADRAVLAEAWRAAPPQARAYKGWASLDAGAEALFSRWGV
ncbi:MAG: heme-dependent oxidative N-demethylase subunit alpha family protein [Pseudomonadota bacterium]